MSGHRNTFPRGFVLGLTVAEIAILIIFVLLLALTMLLARETERRQAAERELQQLQEIRLIFEERGATPEELLSSIRIQVDNRQAAENWNKLVRSLKNQLPDTSPETIVSRLIEAQEVKNRLDEELARTDSDDRSAADNWNDLVRGVGDSIPDASPEAIISKLNEAKDLMDTLEEATAGNETGEMDRQDLVNLFKEFAKTQVGGRGTDHPSCWYNADGTVAYLFDVELRDDGFTIQRAHAPQHNVRDDPELAEAVGFVMLRRPISPEQFTNQTLPVYQWSRNREPECRFFVRAFDSTAADQKELYKTRMRTLESHFYKNANPSGPSPFPDPELPSR